MKMKSKVVSCLVMATLLAPSLGFGAQRATATRQVRPDMIIQDVSDSSALEVIQNPSIAQVFSDGRVEVGEREDNRNIRLFSSNLASVLTQMDLILGLSTEIKTNQMRDDGAHFSGVTYPVVSLVDSGGSVLGSIPYDSVDFAHDIIPLALLPSGIALVKYQAEGMPSNARILLVRTESGHLGEILAEFTQTISQLGISSVLLEQSMPERMRIVENANIIAVPFAKPSTNNNTRLSVIVFDKATSQYSVLEQDVYWGLASTAHLRLTFNAWINEANEVFVSYGRMGVVNMNSGLYGSLSGMSGDQGNRVILGSVQSKLDSKKVFTFGVDPTNAQIYVARFIDNGIAYNPWENQQVQAASFIQGFSTNYRAVLAADGYPALAVTEMNGCLVIFVKDITNNSKRLVRACQP